MSITVLISWGHPSPGQDITAQAAKANGYSGEDLFRGIFFAEGEVAAKIPPIMRLRGAYGLSQLNEKQRQAVRTLEDSLIAALKRGDSGYFVDFQAEIQSGDHFRILAQLKNTARLISYILFERNKGLGQLLDNSRNDRFKQRLAATGVKELRDRVPADTAQLYTSLESVGKGIQFDRDIFINRITNRIRNFDVDYALDLDLNVNRYTFVDRYANLNIFRFLDVDRNLFNHFDKVAAIRFVC